MKKILNKLLVICLVCAVLIFLFSAFTILTYSVEFNASEKVMDDVSNMSPDDPGGGWYFLIFGSMAAITDIAIVLFVVIRYAIIPIALALVNVAGQCIARLFQIGQEQRWKNITSTVFAVVSTVVQGILCLILVWDLLLCGAINGMGVLAGILMFLALLVSAGCLAMHIIALIKIIKENYLKAAAT